MARVASLQGTVEAQRAGQAAWTPVTLNELLSEGDQLRVLQRSRADLVLLDRSVLRLNENSTITIHPVKGRGTGVVDLLRGAVHIFSRGPDSLSVNTPFTVAGVRGTEFLVQVEADRTLITTFEGTVVASNDAGSVTVNGGQSAVAERGRPPVLRVVARPRDAVQWTLYYPPVLYFRPAEFADGPGWEGKVRLSLTAYGRGDTAGGLAGVADIPSEEVKDGRFFTYRAHLLLTVGRVDEARADVDRALALSPADPDALALQAIVAVVQNDAERALRIALAAVEGAPRSASAHVALSYAKQARFDLAGARAAATEATRLAPENALAWARLAELHAAHGDLGAAGAAAERAAGLDPALARTQTVLGYASLARSDVSAARAAFEKAIALDSADPLPRLGLGLAKIRDGDVAAGARELETAASLDPGNPVVRSYLGKAYYEEKRAGFDEREYQAASEVDPRDPTPWLYGAIAKQTTNRPVEALRDLERAIELNDDRAVYRSRLLLDSDLAARSASLGRIYSDLGFQQLALAEGWTSVEADPSNFSAHRFLADSYSVLSRHEIARVSELLQSQLLQPLNVTPIQPTLGEANLFLVGASGVGALAFNEFNPIFNRDRIVLQPAAVGGSRGLFAGETVAAAVQGNASVSAGYSRFQTDGFRPNADQREDIANAFVQYQLSDGTSVQGEYRYRRSERGDVLQRFFATDYFPGQRNVDERNGFRLGLRHEFSPSSILIASVAYVRADSTQRDDQFPDPGVMVVDARMPGQRGLGAELQHLLRLPGVNFRIGAGYFDSRRALDMTLTLGPPIVPGPMDLPTSTTDLDVQHVNGYVYADIHAIPRLTITVGGSFDSLHGAQPGSDTSQLNPKLGVIWRPLAGTTVRAGAFRVLKRTLTTQQTLEPTEVAGLNQFYDDVDLTSSWRFGAGVDQKVASTLFAGAELSRRKLTVPYLDYATDPNAPQSREAPWNEVLGRSYLFWLPHRWIALRAEYVFERADIAPELQMGVTQVDTHRVPLGVSFFHPSGLSLTARGTWVRQSGDFGGYVASSPLRPGRDEYWLLDAGLGYRLPLRYGLISAGVTNLLDRNFQFFDTDLRNSSLQPGRTVYGRITLAFP
jgi:tetratricopeptide (TPR) repeat protein